MTTRRSTIHDYPEHLNPFYEATNKSDRNSKYGTWGSSTRNKIRQTVLDSTWIEALNLSPAKKKVTKKWSLFKSHTVEKFQRSRSKSNSFEHTIQRPERRQSPINIRPQRLFSERFVATSTPVKAQTNVWTRETNQPEVDNKYELQGARPKLRKKKAAPRPPSSILTPDSDTSVDLGIWNMNDSVDSGIQQSPVDEEINAIAVDINVESELSTDLHPSCSNEKTSHETHIRPLMEQPNIATLISNNLTL